jgi:hypothetical protein
MEFELGEKHIEYLKHIRKVKINFFLRILLAVFFIPAALVSLQIIGVIMDPNPQFGNIFKGFSTLAVFFLPVVLIIIIKYLQPLLKDLKKINKDIRLKSGVMQGLLISRKKYFTLSQQCFFFFDNPKIQNIKIDSNTFQQYQEGDTFSFGIAQYSQIIFEDYLRFDIIA